MRSLHELTATDDPAIPLLREWVAEGDNVLHPLASSELAEQSLLAIQVTTRSMLGAMVFETGGISAFGGRIRLLGSGADRSLLGVNQALGLLAADAQPAPASALVLGDDVLGGLFVLNGGALGAESLGQVFWLPPDDMDWCDLEVGHSDFLNWCLTGEWDAIYASVQAPSALKALAQANPAFDRSWSIFPFLWTQEGKQDADLRIVLAQDVMAMRLSLLRQMG